MVLHNFPRQRRLSPVRFSFLPSPPPSTDLVVVDHSGFRAFYRSARLSLGSSQQCLPRPLPTHSRMTTARQSLRTTPFFLRKAQVRRPPLFPLSSLPSRVNELPLKDKMRPSPLLKHDPLPPHSPPPLSTPTTVHDPVHHSASSTALPRKMQPPSPIPAPVREAP